MINEITEFITSFRMVSNGKDLVYNLTVNTSRLEIKSKTQKSFYVENLEEAISNISKLHHSINNVKIIDTIKNSLKTNSIQEKEPFYLVIQVKDGQQLT